jgi:membrane protease YdiL (CAAX protease family)
MKENFSNRYRLLPLIIACYFIPLLLLGVIGGLQSSPAALWNMVGIGLLVSAIGSLLLFFAFLSMGK